MMLSLKEEDNMNRFKKELRKRGYKLEQDYPSMPYSTDSNYTIEAIKVDAEHFRYIMYCNVDTLIIIFDRHMQPHAPEEYHWNI